MVVHTSYLSGEKVGKARYYLQFGSQPGESRLNGPAPPLDPPDCGAVRPEPTVASRVSGTRFTATLAPASRTIGKGITSDSRTSRIGSQGERARKNSIIVGCGPRCWQRRRAIAQAVCKSPASLRTPSRGKRRLRYLVGDHLEVRQRARTERGHDRDVGRVAPARHQDAADARHVVARIEGVPAPAEIGLEPGGEISRADRAAPCPCRRDSRCNSAPECSCSGTA